MGDQLRIVFCLRVKLILLRIFLQLLGVGVVFPVSVRANLESYVSRRDGGSHSSESAYQPLLVVFTLLVLCLTLPLDVLELGIHVQIDESIYQLLFELFFPAFH